jgi:hypothetical protein
MRKAERERRIEETAYSLWQQEGSPVGRSLDHWLWAEQAFGRAYGVSRLPLVREELPPEVAREIRLRLYSEACSSWRMLTDVRFKLLGAVPAVTGVALYGLFALNAGGPGITRWVRGLACLAGLGVTLGLVIYNTRNDGLYDDLISRARRIEHELGVYTGLFLGRKAPPTVLVQHNVATWLIYGVALLAWAAAAVFFLAGWPHPTGRP